MPLARRGDDGAVTVSEGVSRDAAGPGAAPRFFCGSDYSGVCEAERQFAVQLAVEKEAYARHEACVEMGQRCPDANGEPCWYCEDEASDDDSYDAWEGDSGFREEGERGRNASPATFCGFRKSFLCKTPASVPPAGSNQSCSLLDIPLPQKQQLTAEEAERNAEELVAEEERVKRKAEKKRMKKKRQKDRKRQEKQDQQFRGKSQAQAVSTQATSSQKSGRHDRECSPAAPGAPRSLPPESEGTSAPDLEENLTSSGGSSSRSTEEESEEELDLTSTFVSKARLKAGTKLLLPKKEKASRPEKKELEEKAQEEVPRSGLQMTPVEQSMVLADCGNETAKQGCYQEAVLLFTEAVKLNPRDYRLFGNRSFCYEKLQCYSEALCDAQLALSLHPGWPKGLFRLGKALVGLKRYTEAARTFEGLLQFDGFRGDAAVQLEKCRVQLRLKNGFSHQEWNVLPRGPQPSLTGGRPARGSSTEAGGHSASIGVTSPQGEAPSPSAAPAPARERFAVWVGNLTPKITQDVLLRYFQPFGPIDSIRLLPRRFCAFVNYTCREAAEAAYAALQGAEVEGSKLVLQLKHPVHATPAPTKDPVAHGQPPLKWETGQLPSGILDSSWLRHLGH